MKGKIAIVTGAASGIGRATAVLLAKNKFTVIVSDINEDGMMETADMISSAGGTGHVHMCDVSEKDQVVDLMNRTKSTHGSLDAVVNNAGIGGKFAFTHDYEDELYDKVIAVNQTGVWYCMKQALMIMKEQQDGGTIVNVSSLAGIGAAPMMSAYAASKHAVIGLTKTAAAEYGKYNIRVNAVCPTVIDTPMGQSLLGTSPELAAKMKFSIPMRRFGEAKEVAEVISWLSSKSSSYVNGQEIRIDGGQKA